jgi:hypothetical protein
MFRLYTDLINQIAEEYQFRPESEEYAAFKVGCTNIVMAVSGVLNVDQAMQNLEYMGLAGMPGVLGALKEFVDRAKKEDESFGVIDLPRAGSAPEN